MINFTLAHLIKPILVLVPCFLTRGSEPRGSGPGTKSDLKRVVTEIPLHESGLPQKFPPRNLLAIGKMVKCIKN